MSLEMILVEAVMHHPTFYQRANLAFVGKIRVQGGSELKDPESCNSHFLSSPEQGPLAKDARCQIRAWTSKGSVMISDQ